MIANAHGTILYGLKVTDGGEHADRCVSWLPLYHDMGLIGFCLTPMLSQLTVDYLSTSDFARRSLVWLKLISENKGTLSYSPSFGYNLCLQRAANGAAAGYDLSSWRVAGIGGDMVRPDVLRKFVEVFTPNGFRETAFVPSYGLAECTLATSFAPLDRPLEIDTVDRTRLAEENLAVPADDSMPAENCRSFVLCGHVLLGHDLEIRDAQDHPLPEHLVEALEKSNGGPELP